MSQPPHTNPAQKVDTTYTYVPVPIGWELARKMEDGMPRQQELALLGAILRFMRWYAKDAFCQICVDGEGPHDQCRSN